MTIKLIIGPMFSGKSSYLLAEERKSKIARKKVVCVKHALDMRYTSGSEIATHNKEYSTAPSYATQNIGSILSELLQYDVILIDEGQFFSDLVDSVETLIQHNKQIVIAALSSDYKRLSFQPIAEILPKVDQLIHLCAICTICGNNAPFTSRLSSEGDQTVIGGAESYEPRCRTCFK